MIVVGLMLNTRAIYVVLDCILADIYLLLFVFGLGSFRQTAKDICT